LLIPGAWLTLLSLMLPIAAATDCRSLIFVAAAHQENNTNNYDHGYDDTNNNNYP
jgi:hypothetical protein